VFGLMGGARIRVRSAGDNVARASRPLSRERLTPVGHNPPHAGKMPAPQGTRHPRYGLRSLPCPRPQLSPLDRKPYSGPIQGRAGRSGETSSVTLRNITGSCEVSQSGAPRDRRLAMILASAPSSFQNGVIQLIREGRSVLPLTTGPV